MLQWTPLQLLGLLADQMIVNDGLQFLSGITTVIRTDGSEGRLPKDFDEGSTQNVDRDSGPSLRSCYIVLQQLGVLSARRRRCGGAISIRVDVPLRGDIGIPIFLPFRSDGLC